MGLDFQAVANPSKKICENMSSLAPANPFHTFNYLEARRILGFQPWFFGLYQDSTLKGACSAFMKSGWLNKFFEIASMPAIPDAKLFWEGILHFSVKERISHLKIDSFASPGVNIPALQGEIIRRTRSEYIINLQEPNLWSKISTNHSRNIKKGRKAGFQVRRATDEQSCRDHASIGKSSMARRRSRGETVPEDLAIQGFLALTQSGAGEIFQAFLDGDVLSSILVLKAEKGGYYQSGGTTPEGMASGASHFLMHQTAEILKSESKEIFNLGGAEPSNPGLARFKIGFGTSCVELEAAEFFLGSKIRKKISELIHIFKP